MTCRIDKQWPGGSILVAALVASLTFVPWTPVVAQTVSPTSITIPDASPVCNDGSMMQEVCITLPPESVIDKVDVYFLFDDTGSFSGFVPTVTGIFGTLVTQLQVALPAVDFGFGVGRFEDYGGPGQDYGGFFSGERPFLLNQPIVNTATAGSPAALNTLINNALNTTAWGGGGDGPESAIAEGLYQVATGVGFDGDGDGLTTGIGGTQPAGALGTQTSADTSGDVPAISTLVAAVPASGTVGGALFRSDALKLVILATDICPISPFAPPTIPATVVGTGSTEAVAEFACTSTDPGTFRFGFVGNALSDAGNTQAGAVAPLGATTVPATIAALNAMGIRVLGMAPGGGPTAPGSGPSFSPSVFLSALARLTGAVDGVGNPLVFDISGGDDPLREAIVNAILTTTTLPVDITLETSGTIPAGVTVSITPDEVEDVGPGETACFDVTFTGSGDPNGPFDLDFKDMASGAVLGTVPVSVECIPNIPPDVVCNAPTVPTDPGQCSAMVDCDIIAHCFDPDSGGVVPVCAPPGPYPVGTSNVEVFCDDGEDSDEALCPVTVVDCEDPVCSAPDPVTLECNTAGGVSSSDPAVAAFLGMATAADNCGVTAFGAFLPDLFLESCADDTATPVVFTANDARGHAAVCASSVTVVDTTPPDVDCDALLVTVFDDEDADDEGEELLEIDFNASDLCCGAAASGVIDIGCAQISVVDGQLLDLECVVPSYKAPCEAEFEDGVLEIAAEAAELRVVGFDCSGLSSDCVVNLCDFLPDEDEDHDTATREIEALGANDSPDGLLDLGFSQNPTSGDRARPGIVRPERERPSR